MKNRIILLITILLCLTSVSLSQSSNDLQFWNETIVSLPVIKSKDENGKEFDRFSVQLIGNFRLGRNSIQSGDKRIGAGFEYRINKFVSLQPSYLFRAETTLGRRTAFESRFRLALNLQKDWPKVHLRQRNMLDYRKRQARADDPTFYRSRLQVIFPMKKIQPYVMDEVYYEFESNQITRNRLFFGFNKRINKNLTSDFFYVWQRNRQGTIKNINGIGINVRIRVSPREK